MEGENDRQYMWRESEGLENHHVVRGVCRWGKSEGLDMWEESDR